MLQDDERKMQLAVLLGGRGSVTRFLGRNAINFGSESPFTSLENSDILLDNMTPHLPTGDVVHFANCYLNPNKIVGLPVFCQSNLGTG